MIMNERLAAVPLTESQHAALLAARANHGFIRDIDPRTRAALGRRGLIEGHGRGWRWTTAGRLQVQWFADECAEWWGVTTQTWNTYVRRGTAPTAAYPGTPRSTVDRAWWDADTVRRYVRPGSQAGPESQRVQVDHSELLRTWRKGQRTDPPMSIGTLAARFEISPTTASALLERMGEKPPTSASLRAGNGPTSGQRSRLLR